MRIILIISALIIVTILIGIPSYLGPDDLKKCPTPQPGTCAVADAIVTVSGGDTVARTDKAIRLYKEGWAPLVIFSGAAADTSGPSNALSMKRYAIESGIPTESIEIEEFSQTTAENAVNTSLYLKKRDIQRIVLVTSAYHQRRAELEFQVRIGDQAEILNHPVREDDQWSRLWFTNLQGWSLALSELGKIMLFYISRGPVT